MYYCCQCTLVVLEDVTVQASLCWWCDMLWRQKDWKYSIHLYKNQWHRRFFLWWKLFVFSILALDQILWKAVELWGMLLTVENFLKSSEIYIIMTIKIRIRLYGRFHDEHRKVQKSTFHFHAFNYFLYLFSLSHLLRFHI